MARDFRQQTAAFDRALREMARKAQPRTGVVSYRRGDTVWVKRDGSSGATAAGGDIPIHYAGPYDLDDGDAVLWTEGGQAGRQIIQALTSSKDGTRYPRVRADVILAPSETLTLEALIIEDAFGFQINAGKVKTNAADGTPGYLEDELVGGEGVAANVVGSSNKNMAVTLDINSLDADASPDGAADYVAVYDTSANYHKKVLLNNLPGGGGSGAPVDATYIVQTADGTLTNEQALSALESGDVQVTTTTGVLSSLKANRAASTDPGVSDDSSAGYSVGSEWVNTTDDKAFVCVDASAGAAVWKETTAFAGAGSGDVTGPTSSTDNAVALFDGTDGKTLKDSLVTLDNTTGTVVLYNSATRGVLNVTQRSAAPSSPAAGDIYLDDGTNTTSGDPGLRHYTGTVWEDIGGGGSGGTDTNAFHDNVAGEINALSAVTSIDASDAILLESADSSYQKRKLTGETLSNTIFSISASASTLYVRNNAPSIASRGEIGFVRYDSTYGLVFEKTNVAGKYTDQFAYVYSGGDPGTEIQVLTRSQNTSFTDTVQVQYSSLTPHAGDFLITSTFTGEAQRQEYLSPNVFAVCVADGDTSTLLVEAQLIMNRTRKPLTSDNDILRINAASDFGVSGDEWIGTINDTPPISSPVTVSTIQGSLANITPASSSEHGHIVIHNTGTGNAALVSSISGNDITFVDDAALTTWVPGDTLTSASQTITGAGIARDVDLSLSPILPSLAVELGVIGVWRDTGGVENLDLHPYEPYANSKSARVRSQVANVFTEQTVSLPLIDGKFGVRNGASGAGTGLLILRYSYVVEATP